MVPDSPVIRVDFTDTAVADAGLECLEGLTELQALLLDNTKVTDAGLEHVKGLTQLRELASAKPKLQTLGWSTLRA